MYSRKRLDSHRYMGGRSHVFCFDIKSLGTWLFSTTVKEVGTVAHQWMDLVINIQRSRTPLVFEICLIPLQYVLNTDSDESWHTLCVHLSNVCLPLHTPRSLHSRGQCPNARLLSVNLSPFLSNVFSVFFHWMRPSNVYCWRSSCLDLGTAQAIIPHLISDPVSNTHQISIWSPPRLLYHYWLLIRSRTPIRSRFGHRPGYYTTIDFWFGLAHPSDAKSSVISQMSLSQYYMSGV